MGCRQCLPLSGLQLKGKHCRKPHCCNGVVENIRLGKDGPYEVLAVIICVVISLYFYVRLTIVLDFFYAREKVDIDLLSFGGRPITMQCLYNVRR